MKGKPIELIMLIKEFLAVSAPAGNALRNQERGVVRDIQERLRRIELDDVPKDNVDSYEQWLNRSTVCILDSLQVQIRPWGTVRKALNLFMRSCLCDYHLRRHYDLCAIEQWAEMPLDSIVANALKREAGRGRLPEWPGLKHLDAEASCRFQVFAADLAARKGLPGRVYLDYDLWLSNR